MSEEGYERSHFNDDWKMVEDDFKSTEDDDVRHVLQMAMELCAPQMCTTYQLLQAKK